MSSTINIIINNSKKMTNYNFKMGTFSFRFLENFCQLQLSVGKRSSQNDLAWSPIISVCTYVRTAVEPKQLNDDTCRRRVIFLVQIKPFPSGHGCQTGVLLEVKWPSSYFLAMNICSHKIRLRMSLCLSLNLLNQITVQKKFKAQKSLDKYLGCQPRHFLNRLVFLLQSDDDSEFLLRRLRINDRIRQEKYSIN